MPPPFQITHEILNDISKIERLIGRLESLEQPKPQPYLRKSNRVRTVQGSLAIEGNTLNLDQVTALLDGKSVIGKKTDIREVLNAIEVYDQMMAFRPHSIKSLLKAHRMMMTGLVDSAGKWRSGNIGVFKGSAVSHVAPPPGRVPYLMQELFDFLKNDNNHAFIRSAVFHYELEFIHPFEDGNGRMGRFWHSLLLSHYHPVFEFTPVESLIKIHQQDYYNTLQLADKAGDSTGFIEFSMYMIYLALSDLIDTIRPEPSSVETRLQRALAQFGDHPFSRKEYMKFLKNISSATASRDLKAGVDRAMLEKSGERALTIYRFLH